MTVNSVVNFNFFDGTGLFEGPLELSRHLNIESVRESMWTMIQESDSKQRINFKLFGNPCPISKMAYLAQNDNDLFELHKHYHKENQAKAIK